MADDTNATGKVYGKYPGIVVDNQPQGGADKYQGDIRVRVSSILDEDRMPVEVWAKPCFHPGFFFIPEVDDSVWVEFVAGDIDFAVWTGVWYPQGNTPKTSENQGAVTENKVIRSASGHVVEMDDSGAKINIVDKSGNQITLEENGITITDKSDNQIVMTAAGVTVKSDSIKLGSDSALEPLVLGNQFLQLFNSHMHIGNMGAPTSPPAGAGTPATPAQLSATHKTE